jgi:hypothetical protein
MSQVASRAKINSPPLRIMMDTLHKVNSPPHLMCSVLGLSYGNVVEIQRLNTLRVASLQEGYAASRSHIASNAIKTNCPMAECMRIAKNLRQSSVLALNIHNVKCG